MNLYQQTVLEARKKFLKLNLQQDKEIFKIYEEAGLQIVERLSKAKAGGLTSRYLTELDKSINQYKRELSTKLSKSIKDGMEASSQIASAVQLSYLDNIAPSEDLKATFRKMFSQLDTDVVKTLISGNYYKDGKTLDNRIWNISKKNTDDINRIIKVNVANGANARDLAKQLDNYINPKNRISSKPIYITNEKGKLVKLPPPSGISNNISYQAQRLARTSLDHANTETYIQGSKKNPFCKGLKWNLSSSHYERQVKRHGPDICDKYAKENEYDLGPGVFPADKYPIAHCNCLCYCTTVMIDIEDARAELIAWVKGENNSKLDKWLKDYGEEFGL